MVYPDCQLAAIHGLTDLFRISNEWAARAAGAEDYPHIRVSHWRLDEAAEAVVCAWDTHPGPEHRLSHIIAPPSLVMPNRMQPQPRAAEWMRAQHADGVTLCSVCAGAFVLAETGLINGRRATTHWAFADELAERFPQVELASSQMVVDDGDIMTAGGILAWTDLGLTLVSKFMGPGVMLATARFLLIDPPRPAQNTFAAFIPRFDHGDAEILRIQHHLHANCGEPQNVPDLAARVGLTERTFLRRFAKAAGLRPTEYLQQVRMMKARDALELSRQPVDTIAWSVGYADPAAFRKVFQKATGVSPHIYRQRFGQTRATAGS